jgi:hypothetical protein
MNNEIFYQSFSPENQTPYGALLALQELTWRSSLNLPFNSAFQMAPEISRGE